MCNHSLQDQSDRLNDVWISDTDIFDYYLFFFLMIRRPPRSTPFPTRRSSDLYGISYARKFSTGVAEGVAAFARSGLLDRSEEHTSELQSQSNIVCRLLLEKKSISQNLLCAAAASATSAACWASGCSSLRSKFR